MSIQAVNTFKHLIRTKPKTFLVWALFSMALAFYSFLVWEASYKMLPYVHDEQAVHDTVTRIEAEGDLSVPYAQVAKEAADAYPLWNNLTAMVTGTYFGYGSNGNSTQVLYYNSMKPIEKSALSYHMVLGGICLILGILQFTPSFRKTYRKAHRMVGGVYILGVFSMTFAAIYHMIHTGIEHTYQGFAFHIQLWALAISTIICQILAIHHIKKRNIALHLGFQLYTFVAFLNAPIQRYDWAFLGNIYPHLTQGEVNNMVNMLTFWQCLMIGCMIFAWNRASSPMRSKPLEIAPQPVALKVFLSLAGVVAIWTVLSTYLGTAGLGSWTAVQAIVPASTLAADAMLYANHPLLTTIFAVLMVTAIASGLWLMLRNETSRLARNFFYVSAIWCGIQQVVWGFQLGEPSMAVTAGGGFYMVSGVSLLAFAALALYQQVRGYENKWHESMIFAVNFAFAPALVIWGHALWYTLDVIPEYYINRGHGYVLAVGIAVLMPSFNGFIEMMTSRETKSRAIS